MDKKTILTKPLVPLLVKTSIPTIIGMLIVVIYNLTDTFFIGMLNNKSMTASIGIVFSYISIIQAIGFWFGYGSGNIMSKKIGESKREEARNISLLAILLAIIIGFILSISSLLYLKPLGAHLGGDASADLLFYTIKYLKTIILSVPFILYSITIYNQLRLSGKVKDAMMGLLVGILSNIILDPVLIFTFKIGFIGAGYATLIGQVISSIFLTKLALKDNPFIFTLKNVKIKKTYIYHILIGGMPNFSRQIITSLSLVCLNIVATRFGEELIASLTISSRILAIAYMVMIGWSQGFQPICAMNYGAKEYSRVKKAFMITVSIGTIFMVLSAIILYYHGELFISMMSKDKLVIERGIKLIQMQCFSMPFLAYFALSSMFMQNTGRYFRALIISTSRQGLFYIPLLFLLSSHYGEYGIFIVQPISDILSVILSTIILAKTISKVERL